MTRRLAILALATAATLGASHAAAYQCTRAGDDGPSLAWGPRVVVVQPSGAGAEVSDPAALNAVLTASVDAWNGIACSDIELAVGTPTDDQVAGFDWEAGSGSQANHNIVVFRDNTPDDAVDAWLHDLSALAITTVTFEGNAGRLLDADIEVNDAAFRFSTCDPGPDCVADFDLQNTITHELGHVLGLDHSDIAEATMFPTATRGDVTKRSVAPDDAEAICVIYPAGLQAGECYGVGREDPPDVRFSPTVCGSGGSQAPVALLVLLIPIVRRRSKTRRTGS